MIALMLFLRLCLRLCLRQSANAEVVVEVRWRECNNERASVKKQQLIFHGLR